jgi:hypothetical protein
VKVRLGIAGLLVVLLSCGSSAGATRHCGPAGASTLSSSPQARVYSWHGGVFGCSFARGRSFRLGSADRSIRESRVAPVAVAGTDAAYGLSNFGVDTVRTEVIVRRLTDGKRLADFSATRAGVAEGFQSVGSVAIKSDGAVAWIGAERSIIAGRQAIEVHAADAGASGDRLLDSSPQVAPNSLRLHGSTLSWRHGITTRRATLR